MIMRWKWRREILLFTLGVTSVLPTLWGTFIFDDEEAIINNEDVIGKSLRTGTPNSGTGLFWNDFWGSRITHPNSHKSYRPLTTLTYRLDFHLWGKNPYPFHFSNWVIHGVNCILVYHFLCRCNKVITSNLNGSSLKLSAKEENVIFWSSILFSVHPVHVEPLGGLVGRADLVSSMIFLFGFILNSFFTNEITPFILIPVIGILGSLFKENCFVIVISYLSFRLVSRKRLAFSYREFGYYAVSILITSIFMIWRLWFQDGPPLFQKYDNPPAFAEPLFSKISSITYIWILNVFILVNPTWLSFDWSMGCISLIESPLDVRFSLVVILGLVGIRFLVVAAKSRTLLIASLIGLTTFLPSSNLFFTVGFVIAERNLYLPSIGFALLMSHCFLKYPRGKWGLAFVVLVFYIRSIQRSFDWINPHRLFLSATSVCPNNAKVYYNIGAIHAEGGNTGSAIEYYKRALELKSDYYQAMNNLGNILRTTNQSESAEFWLRQAVEAKEDFAAAWMNLGIVLSKKNVTEAMECYKNALKHRQFYPDCEYNIGNLYLDMGENDFALMAWTRAIHLQPGHVQSWLNIIIFLEKGNRLSEAKEYAHKALEAIGDADSTLQFLMGNIYGRLNEFEKAEAFFGNAIKIGTTVHKPAPAKYWSNLGVLYHRWGKLLQARQCYAKALAIQPQLDSASNNLERLLKLEEQSNKL